MNILNAIESNNIYNGVDEWIKEWKFVFGTWKLSSLDLMHFLLFKISIYNNFTPQKKKKKLKIYGDEQISIYRFCLF